MLVLPFFAGAFNCQLQTAAASFLACNRGAIKRIISFGTAAGWWQSSASGASSWALELAVSNLSQAPAHSLSRVLVYPLRFRTCKSAQFFCAGFQ